ncbi:MAG: AAA family ATPase, partial [Dehalococcoidia bacterium]
MAQQPAGADPEIQRHLDTLREIRGQIGRVIVGQDALVERLLIALLTSSHALIEGVPGLAKTLTVSSLARTLRCSFTRIQFTPDLLPADI